MGTCGRCGHDNADRLAYCSACGRRLTGSDRVPSTAEDRAPIGGGDGARSDTTRDAPTAFAATVAIAKVHETRAELRGPPADRRVLTRGIEAVHYVFGYVRGRMDAEGRKRRLIEERDGARRLVEGALVELGQLVLAELPDTPEFLGLADAVVRAQARHEGATTDLAAAERFQATEDLRLGMQQSAVETEWMACETGAAGVDETLRQLDDQRREVDIALSRLRDDPEADVGHLSADRASLGARRSHLGEQVAALRERGAALRASTTATRAKLDQVTAARRQAAVAVAASIVGHNRDRAEGEKQMRDITTEIGQTARRVRLPRQLLLPSYARIDRLEETITDRDREIADAERAIGRADLPKMAAGLGVLTGILGVLGIGLWALLH